MIKFETFAVTRSFMTSRIGPLPSVFRSAHQWFRVGLWTAFYGVPESAHLLAFSLVRQCRKLQPSNEHLRQVECYFLHQAEFYRRRWSDAFCSTFNIDVELEFRFQQPIKPDENVFFVQLNQQSMLETPVVPMALPDRSQRSQDQELKNSIPFMFIFQNIEFALIPLVGWNLAIPGIVIRRGNQRSTRAGVERCLERVRLFHDKFYMSVEGQRSRDGQLGVYKKGAAIMAIQTQADIIPMFFENAGALWSFGQWRIRPGRVKLIFHDRISTKGLTLKDKDQLTQQLRQLAESELNRINKIAHLPMC